MATRSYIVVQTAFNQFRGIYCHWDGYPDYVGATLDAHYDSPEKALTLIQAGHLSQLGARLRPAPGESHSFEKPAKDTCVFYGWDRGEKGMDSPDVFKGWAEVIGAADGAWAEWVYLWPLGGTGWLCAKVSEDLDQEDLAPVREYIGVPGRK